MISYSCHINMLQQFSPLFFVNTQIHTIQQVIQRELSEKKVPVDLPMLDA